MRRLTTTVNVITTVQDGEWSGMTATAVTSVCTEPATLLVCVNKAASLYQRLDASRRFAVNLLRVGQQDVSAAFSGQLKGSDRFTVGDWQADNGEDIPYLADAQANIFCSVETVWTHGTHAVFLGGVTGVRICDPVHPLLYQDGRYAQSAYL